MADAGGKDLGPEQLLACLRHGPDGVLRWDAAALAGFLDGAMGLASGARMFAVVNDVVRIAAMLTARPDGAGAGTELMAEAAPLIATLETKALAEHDKEARQSGQRAKLSQAASGRTRAEEDAGANLAPRQRGGVSLRRS